MLLQKDSSGQMGVIVISVILLCGNVLVSISFKYQ